MLTVAETEAGATVTPALTTTVAGGVMVGVAGVVMAVDSMTRPSSWWLLFGLCVSLHPEDGRMGERVSRAN